MHPGKVICQKLLEGITKEEDKLQFCTLFCPQLFCKQIFSFFFNSFEIRKINVHFFVVLIPIFKFCGKKVVILILFF
jgi:hypothetical protein